MAADAFANFTKIAEVDNAKTPVSNVRNIPALVFKLFKLLSPYPALYFINYVLQYNLQDYYNMAIDKRTAFLCFSIILAQTLQKPYYTGKEICL